MKQTEVALLGVLHNYHSQVPTYSLEHLKHALIKIAPDVICVELKKSDLDSKEFNYKQEYQVILPYAKENNVLIEALDPEEPTYSEICKPYMENHKRHKNDFPVEDSVLEKQITHMFTFLIQDHWSTLAKTQSELTHSLIDIKHRIQEDLLGKAEKEGWEKINKLYLDRILAICEIHKGKRIMISIGIEHIYWLKNRITTYQVLDLEKILV